MTQVDQILHMLVYPSKTVCIQLLGNLDQPVVYPRAHPTESRRQSNGILKAASPVLEHSFSVFMVSEQGQLLCEIFKMNAHMSERYLSIRQPNWGIMLPGPVR